MSQQINLYEVRLRPSRDWVVGRNLAAVSLVVLLVVCVVGAWATLGARRAEAESNALQKQLVSAREVLAALDKAQAQRTVSPGLAADIERSKAQLAARREVLAVLDAGQVGQSEGFFPVMAGFANQARSDLWLTGFRVVAGGEEMEIRGRALDAARLPAYVADLSKEPAFKGRRFAALEVNDVEAPPVAASSGGAAPAPLPRFVEFVLRSEHVAALGDAPAPRRVAASGRAP